jgi:hypothetical protein
MKSPDRHIAISLDLLCASVLGGLFRSLIRPYNAATLRGPRRPGICMAHRGEKIEVAHFARTEVEAAVVVAALREAGIDAQMEGALTSALRAEAPGEVRILVRNCDLPRARQIIADRPQ